MLKLEYNYNIVDHLLGRLEGKKIGTVLRLIGGVPTQGELDTIIATVGEEGTVNFQEFLDIVEKHRGSHGFMADELR